MITIDNYFKEIEKININTFPETFRKSHDFILKSIGNGNNWNLYHNNVTIKRTIDLYLTKVNEFVASKKKEANTETGKKQTQPKNYDISKSQKAAAKSKVATQNSRSSRKQNTNTKKVEHIKEEIKYIKRFIGLHNKVKSSGAILSFIKALQKSIVQKLIRKTSPLAKEIEMIQDKLVNAFNKMKGDEKFQINDKDLPKLVSIAGGEEVYPSINFIKRFIGMQGKQMEEKKIELFLKQLENSLINKKITTDDPYNQTIKSILKRLKHRTSATISIGKSELNGLEEIVKNCSCKSSLGKIYNTYGKSLRQCRKQTYSDARKGACSYNKGLSGVGNGLLTAEEMANRKVDHLNFTNPWDSLMGKPAKNFTVMFHGEPGAGKTTLLLKFIEYLSNNFGDGLYISSEEHDAPTLTTLVKQLLNPIPKNLHFAPDLKTTDLSKYDFVVLDSVNDLGLKLEDFKELKRKYPTTAFILVLQHTKDGDYRGGKDWEHEIQIGARVENGIVTVYRNRYGIKGALDFFKYFGTQPVQKIVPLVETHQDDNDNINNELM
jgi:hypothetical protein